MELKKKFELYLQGILMTSFLDEDIMIVMIEKPDASGFEKALLRHYDIENRNDFDQVYEQLREMRGKSDFAEQMRYYRMLPPQDLDDILSMSEPDRSYGAALYERLLFQSSHHDRTGYELASLICLNVAGQLKKLITEDEMYRRNLGMIRKLQSIYRSWEDFYISCAVGTDQIAVESEMDKFGYVDKNANFLRRALIAPNSPTNLVGWKTIFSTLMPERVEKG